MVADCAFIKAAGLGTRMGEIGKILPKALWPIFEKSLLELQVDYLQDLGIKKIYMNTSFLSNEIEKYVFKKNLNLIILKENPLLGSGGCIHNLKRLIGDQRVLITNADQFIFSKKLNLYEVMDKNFVLLGMSVEKSMGYSRLQIKKNRLTGIIKNSDVDLSSFITFSGLSIIDLSKIKETTGVSNFFDTVANFKENEIYILELEKFEYWDFGTAELYYETMLKALEKKESMLRDFLLKHEGIREKCIVNKNYQSSSGIVIEEGQIFLDGKKEIRKINGLSYNGIYWRKENLGF